MILLFIGHSPVVSSLLRHFLTKPDCLRDRVFPAISLEHDMSCQIFFRLFIFIDHFLIFCRSFLINIPLRFNCRCLLLLISALVFHHSLRLIIINHLDLLYTRIYTSSFAFINCFDSYCTIVLAHVIHILCHSCSFYHTFISGLFLGNRSLLIFSIHHLFFWLNSLRDRLSDLNNWKCLNFLCLFKLKAISDLFKILLEFAFTLPLQV